MKNTESVNWAALRKAAGLTLAVAAERAGYGVATINGLEKRGEGSDRLKVTLASIYGYNPDYLVNPSKYSEHITEAAKEADAMQGTQSAKDALFNRRVLEGAAKLKDRQDGFEAAMKVFSEAEREELREAREKLARVKKLLQQALAEL
jgi:transcriptional regulator with XRE-family HTH domain